ncbi:nucleotide pyrophosphohydrolase [Schaalia vaccimaxillae]|uniref:nucleotide pyrophosphohydrolase n=1 Tax=Schaalia vaccimaxillae TaxID=183916 RepID=UPI0003B7640A|nr:nucleotide pyrophosphohydrolase [Schaalia vaccimaxillae]
MSNELDELIDQVNTFRDEREWRQFHTPKDLALSISVESAELLELFQWRSDQEVVDTRMAGLREEIADVLIYTLMLTDDLGLDPAQIIREKLEINARKYPVDRAKGSSAKYSDLN